MAAPQRPAARADQPRTTGAQTAHRPVLAQSLSPNPHPPLMRRIPSHQMPIPRPASNRSVPLVRGRHLPPPAALPATRPDPGFPESPPGHHPADVATARWRSEIRPMPFSVPQAPIRDRQYPDRLAPISRQVVMTPHPSTPTTMSRVLTSALVLAPEAWSTLALDRRYGSAVLRRSDWVRARAR